jgi:ADP-ribosylglycohydrolase
LWLRNFPVYAVWGPERLLLLKAGLHTFGGAEPPPWEEWAALFNPKEEFCGAMIRVDAYGYACPGRPALAAELAWRDCSWSHRRTGVYGGMFQAAALACAPVMRDRLAIFETALKFVPQRSRFFKIVSDALHEVGQAKDWLDGYQRLYGKYKEYSHCRVHFEAGTLINTLRFAEDVGDGICKQVCQGNDADSYGARAGSLLGAYFGPGHLEPRWLTPFNDDLHTTLAAFYERSLFQVAKRMGELPRRVAGELAGEQRKAQGQEERKQDAGTGW